MVQDGGVERTTDLDDPFDIWPPGRIHNRIRRVDTEGIITTVAGTGEPGFSGDGGQASAAKLDDPEAIAFDAVGDLYIDDYNNERIRRVDQQGIITTVAGTGEPGFSGDGGPATAAKLNEVEDISFDTNGDLLIADTSNNRIRRVDQKGIITTVAGTGTNRATRETNVRQPTRLSSIPSRSSPTPMGTSTSAIITTTGFDGSTRAARSPRSPERASAAFQATVAQRLRPRSTSHGRWPSARARSTSQTPSTPECEPCGCQAEHLSLALASTPSTDRGTQGTAHWGSRPCPRLMLH